MERPWRIWQNRPPPPSLAEFESARNLFFGKANPESMDVPFWHYMVRSLDCPFAMRQHFEVGLSDGNPVWTYQRVGMPSILIEDRYVISIGGEHEDYYDPDFRIYNDVVVRDFHGNVEIYGYPKSDFPPIDFHTANYDGDHYSILIIGGLGYQDARETWRTPVFRLDLRDLVIRPVEVSGDPPGWIYLHQAIFIEPNVLRVFGGKKVSLDNSIEPNLGVYDLDLTSLTWKTVTRS